MSYFPMFMDLSDKTILLVGGGEVAKRKWKTLKEFGAAKVFVVALEVAEEIKNENDDWKERAFEPSDLDGIDFAVLATSDRNINQTIAFLCKKRHILINVADDSVKSDFTFPSYVKKEDLVIGISTAGTAPVIATYIKDKIAAMITDDFMKMTKWMGRLRKEIKKQPYDIKTKKKIYIALLQQFDQTKQIPSQNQTQVLIQKILKEQKKET